MKNNTPIILGGVAAGVAVLYVLLRKTSVGQNITTAIASASAKIADAVPAETDYLNLPMDTKRQILLEACRQIGFQNDSNPDLAKIAIRMQPEVGDIYTDLPSIFQWFYPAVKEANGYENKYRAITAIMNAAGFNVDLHRTHSTGITGVIKAVGNVGATLVSIASPLLGKRN